MVQSEIDSIVEDIKNDFANSKDFVNIFLGYMTGKSDDYKIKLFDKVVENIAYLIAKSKEY